MRTQHLQHASGDNCQIGRIFHTQPPSSFLTRKRRIGKYSRAYTPLRRRESATAPFVPTRFSASALAHRPRISSFLPHPQRWWARCPDIFAGGGRCSQRQDRQHWVLPGNRSKQLYGRSSGRAQAGRYEGWSPSSFFGELTWLFRSMPRVGYYSRAYTPLRRRKSTATSFVPTRLRVCPSMLLPEIFNRW